MREAFAGPEAPHDGDGLGEAAVAGVALGPVLAGDVLIQELPAPEARPESPGVHLAQRGHGLRDDDGVVAPDGAVDHADGDTRGLEGRAEPAPREAGLALGLAPGKEVVRAREFVEAGAFGGFRQNE